MARRLEARLDGIARLDARLDELWKNYGLSIALFALFAVAFLLHTATGWMQYSSEQVAHGEAPALFGDSGYVWYWAEWTLQNWQSEFLELGVIVVLSSFLIHKGSAESKDSDDEIKELLTKIEKQLDGLESGVASKASTSKSSSKPRRATARKSS
jgi:hypothetical protein